MDTAVLEDFLPEVVPPSFRASSTPPSELKSPDRILMLDWQAMLSPSRRSCIKLSNVEPCVNKAVAHLTNIKGRLTKCTRNQLNTTTKQESNPAALGLRKVPGSHDSRTETPKPILVHKDSDSRLGSSRTPQLIIEGVTTGIPVEKQSKPPARVSCNVLASPPGSSTQLFTCCMRKTCNIEKLGTRLPIKLHNLAD